MASASQFKKSGWPKSLKIFLIKDSVMNGQLIGNKGSWSHASRRRNRKVEMKNTGKQAGKNQML